MSLLIPQDPPAPIRELADPLHRSGRPLGLVVLTALAVYGAWRVALPFVGGLTWAVAFAVVSMPLQRLLERRMRPWMAASVSVVLVACLLLVPALFVADRMVRQTVVVLQAVDTQGADVWHLLTDKIPQAAGVTAWLATHLDVSDGVRELAARLPSLARGSMGAVAEIFVALFCLFFLLRDRRTMLAYLRSLLPLNGEQMETLTTRISETIQATVFGRLLIACAQGALGGVMFWCLGLPAPLVWTLVMIFFALIPSLGPFVIWGPAAVFLALDGAWGRALVMTLWGLLVVSLIDNLLYPFLVGSRMQIHPLVVFVSVIGGLALFGPSGLVLGPVLFAVTAALLDLWRDDARC